jgi:hypothetical protein
VSERDTATDSNSSSTDQEVRRVESRDWPGTAKSAKPKLLSRVQAGEKKKKSRSDRWVTVYLGGQRLKLFADTGSKLTIISPNMYQPKMGKVVAANCILRSWGSSSTLDVKGMVRTEIRTEKGARRISWVYIVGGHKPEPLLGDRDAEALGIVTFNPEGREPEKSELEEVNAVQKLREKPAREAPCRRVHREHLQEPGRRDQAGGQGRGHIHCQQVSQHGDHGDQEKFEFEKNFKPIQPQRRGVPYHYQDRLSDHLDMMRKEGAKMAVF